MIRLWMMFSQPCLSHGWYPQSLAGFTVDVVQYPIRSSETPWTARHFVSEKMKNCRNMFAEFCWRWLAIVYNYSSNGKVVTTSYCAAIQFDDLNDLNDKMEFDKMEMIPLDEFLHSSPMQWVHYLYRFLGEICPIIPIFSAEKSEKPNKLMEINTVPNKNRCDKNWKLD